MPSIAPFASAGDGGVRRYSSGTWAATRSAASGDDNSGTGTGGLAVWSDSINPAIARGFFPFDTSAIADDATITAASLFVYVTAKGDAAGGSFVVVESTQASTSSLANSDYSLVGTTELSSRINFSTPATSAYLEIPLNAAGLALINKTGYTKLAIRSSHDLDNSAPSGDSNLQVKYSEQTGTSNDPYLSVTYVQARTTSDSWAWSGSAAGVTNAKTTSDTWAWSDAATRQPGRATTDTWAWSDRASRRGANSVDVTASAGDGFTTRISTSSWSTVRSDATGTAANGTLGADNWCVYNDSADSGGDTNNYIYRGHFPFVFTGVPAGASIASCDLYLYVSSKLSTHDGYVCLVGSTQASASTLATSDYSLVGTTELSPRVRISDLTVGAYNAFPLNAAGLALISGGGTMKLAVRGSADLDNSSPAENTESGFKVNYSEAASNKPYVNVTYDNTRTTGDTWAWSDALADAPVAKAGGGTLYNRRTVGDTWAWSDAATKAYLVTQDVESVLFAAGPRRTTLNGSVNFASLSTITLASMPSGATAPGQVTILSAHGQRAWTVSYTGISGNDLTGCTSWKTSGTAASGTRVAWQNAEANFPSIVNLPATTTYPYGRLFATSTRHCGDDVEGTSDGTVVARYSDDGGQTWSSETVIATAVNSAYGIWGHCSASFADGTLWIAWYEHNIDYVTVKSHSKYSTDGGVTWSSPVEIPATVVEGDSTFIAIGQGPLVDELDDLYLPVYVYPDGADQSITPYVGYSAILKSTDYGATWTLRGTIPITATANRGTTEPAIADLGDGTWIVMLRHEVGSTPGDTLDRYRIFTDDKGATFRDGATAVTGMSNMCNVIRTPDGVLITQGQLEVSPYTPATYYSYDNGLTWPSYQSESTYSDLLYYVGSDQVTVTVGGSQHIATVRGLQGTSSVPLTTAQTYFKWIAVPPYTTDTWAWSDGASRVLKTAGGAGYTLGLTRTPSDTWAWSESASGSFTAGGATYTRTTSDTWAWAGAASGSGVPTAASRSTSDTWGWASPGAAVRATAGGSGDSWAWSTPVVPATVTEGAGITIHPQGMVPGTAIAAYLRWEWRGPVAAKLNAGPGSAVQETTVGSDLTASFTLSPGEYVAYAPTYPTRRLFFMVTPD